MELSPRLKKIVEMVPKCDVLADIGTDHGYVLIELIHARKITKGIASDNKKRPLEKAKINSETEGVIDGIDFRLGEGLCTLLVGEANGAVVAGMGGILTRDILENSLDVVRKMDFLLLQPAQNPEMLRKYLYEGPYDILDEEIIKEDRRFYEYILVRYNENPLIKRKNIGEYQIGECLLDRENELFNEFLESKISDTEGILRKMDLSSENARFRKVKLENIIKEFKGIEKWRNK
ncbi:MAG: class I SAM-dependent methyltransferase [Clostridiaceae bacterium]